MQKVIKNFLIIFILFFSCGNAFAVEITQDYIDIAKNYFNEKNYEKASVYVDYALKIDKLNKDALILKEQIHLIQTKPEDACTETQAVQTVEDFTVLDVPKANTSEMCVEKVKYSRFEKYLLKKMDEGIAKNPDEKLFYKSKLKIYEMNGDVEKASSLKRFIFENFENGKKK